MLIVKGLSEYSNIDDLHIVSKLKASIETLREEINT